MAKSSHQKGAERTFTFTCYLPLALQVCYFETDDWDVCKSIIPPAQHKVGKGLTFYIEGFNAIIKARVSRLARKPFSFSKKDKWHNLAIAWFFWQFNLP